MLFAFLNVKFVCWTSPKGWESSGGGVVSVSCLSGADGAEQFFSEVAGSGWSCFGAFAELSDSVLLTARLFSPCGPLSLVYRVGDDLGERVELCTPAGPLNLTYTQ